MYSFKFRGVRGLFTKRLRILYFYDIIQMFVNEGRLMENANGDIIMYQTDNGLTKIDVRIKNETVWLSQQQMAKLYDTTKQNISLHIKNIFYEEELEILIVN